ncbi:MAG: flagellar hook-associated protein FlgK [SAR86 cluster bacterium]|uniref:Flagellar hook-associated protein 1 n=1 Tax=SAR86 cluster bacterium TaxID=2030880 RepID=A0A2A5B6B4_9GAMM|nr:MAG: flagellar hook-associated protein FlgK [SAR86 cluster bacterium]
MVDLLRMGANSLQSWQQALNTTGHNIANANTDGFSRQTVQLDTVAPQGFGFGFIGQGAKISSIERSHNSFLTSQVQAFASSASRYEVFTQFSSRVDNILANSENSLSHSIQKFFSAVSDVASSPSSLPERQVLIGEAGNLASRQQGYTRLLQDINDEVNAALRFSVDSINNLADSIGSVNKQIVSAISSSNGAKPNDLLDQRDRLVEQLSREIGLTTFEQADGTLNVLIGQGQGLVIGNQITHLETRVNAIDSSRLEVAVVGKLSVNERSQVVKGGQLQGLLDFRSRVLNPAQSHLGLVSLGLTESINAQHQIGMDLNGNMGGNFFQPSAINVAGSTFNTGTTVPGVTLTDSTALRASDYSLVFDGAQWQLTRLSDNNTVSGVGVLNFDGMSIDVSGGVPVAGDSYIFNPARDAGANFALAISDPRAIAAASPLSVDNSLSNTGTAELSNLNVGTSNTLPLAGPITLSFNPDALGAGVPGFDVTGGPGGTIAYNPATESSGKSFTFAGIGISFNISSVPQSGDSFIIENNNGALGDNRNILSVGEIQFQSVLNGGTNTIQEVYGSMVAQVGVATNQGNENLIVETSLLQQAVSYRDSVSGVNLDEEAANLLRYQQAYQASAQLVKIADELFQTLINSI